jgi:hypothetical protein
MLGAELKVTGALTARALDRRRVVGNEPRPSQVDVSGGLGIGRP